METPRILLEEAREQPLSFSAAVPVTVDELGGEPLLAISPLQLSGEISHIEGGEFLVDATLSFSGTLECARCLEPYSFSEDNPVRLRLHHQTSRKPAPAPGPSSKRKKDVEDELELEAGDLDVVYYEEPVLPAGDICREQALIALPMKPLCREDCKGLCEECGTDLNAAACGCVKDTVDARLEVLKHLK